MKHTQRRGLIFIISGITILSWNCGRNKKYTDWRVTGGTKENIRYSSLQQIDTANVNTVQVAWIYHSENNDSSHYGVMECNPIVIDSTLYDVYPKLKLFAIDAATGKKKWQFDPSDSVANKTWHRKSVNMNRGITYWADGNDKLIIYTVALLYLK